MCFFNYAFLKVYAIVGTYGSFIPSFSGISILSFIVSYQFTFLPTVKMVAIEEGLFKDL